MCHDYRNDHRFDRHQRWRGPDYGRGDDCRDRAPDFRDQSEERDFAPDFGFQRKFISRAEKVEALEWYLNELENEAQGVREAIEDLLIEIALDDEDFTFDEDGEQTETIEDEPTEPQFIEVKKEKKSRKK